LRIAALVLIAPAACFAADPPGLGDAKKMVEGNSKFILGTAYPTAKSVDKVTYSQMSTGVDNFDLTYKFDYTDSDGDAAYVTLVFRFTNMGKLLSIRDGGRSSFWAPFTTVKLIAEVLRESAKQDKKYSTDADFKKMVDTATPDDLILGLLNAAAGK
jgi:hypothetical protein